MNTNKLIYWSDGLFLKPHHFQFIDEKIDNTHAFFLDKNYIHHEGFIDYNINEEELKNGILSLKSCELFFKERHIDYPSNANIIVRSIKNDIKDNQSETFYLGIKKPNTDNSSIEIQHIKQLNTKATRYINVETEFESIPNIYNSQDTTDFSYVKYTLQLFTEQEKPTLTDYDLIELCKIKYHNGVFTLVDSHTPPLLTIPKKHRLYDKVDTLFKIIREKAKLIEQDKLKSQNLILLSSIHPLLIEFDVLQQKSYIIPHDVFLLLKKIASILIVFTHDVVFDDIHGNTTYALSYQHDNLTHTFDQCHQRLMVLFEKIIEKKVAIEREFIFPFTKNEDKYFINIQEKFFTSSYSFYIEFITDSKDQLIENINYLKISNDEFIDTVIFSSISDIDFKIVSNSSLKFPVQSNSVYIKINTHDSTWNKIIQTKDLALYIDKTLIKNANLVIVDNTHA